MQSAYKILGLQSTASQDDVEQAYQRIQSAALSPDAAQRLADARTAWQVLRDPDTRTAHDRKLAAAAAAPRRAAAVAEEPSPVMRFLWIGTAVVVLLFAVGGYLSMRNADRRAQAAAAEQAAAEARAREVREQAQAAARLDEQRRADAAKAEQAERRLTAESRAIAAEQNYRNARIESSVAQTRRQEAMQREAQLAADERRQHYEAQRRVEEDKRRVQNLCWQNYGRPNC
jgi:curved DNA-binding protein CbpA